MLEMFPINISSCSLPGARHFKEPFEWKIYFKRVFLIYRFKTQKIPPRFRLSSYATARRAPL